LKTRRIRHVAFARAQTTAQTTRQTVAAGTRQQMHAAAFQTYDGYSQMLTIQLMRFASLSLLHASWAGVVGWFIGFAVL
jgi:hypothetical protein